MSPAEIAIAAVVGPLAVWLLGGLFARLGGLLLVLAGAANLALDPGAEAAALVGVGAAIWLLGHWHYALRHHAFKSPLARHIFCCWAPRRLDPIRHWAVPVAPEATGRARMDGSFRGKSRRDLGAAGPCEP